MHADHGPRRVLVLGASGMLGSMLARVLAAAPGIEVIASSRRGDWPFDVGRDDAASLLARVSPAWVVNATGVLKSRIDEGSPASRDEAVAVNAAFPHALAEAARVHGARVVSIATDGVFDGRGGPYDECADRDATDLYGVTKSAGEVIAEHVLNLRCSVVGPEEGAPRSLLGWVLSQPVGGQIPGFSDQRWNGVTTLHFARVCAGAICEDLTPHGTQHLVPADSVTKAELLELLARAFGREDLAVTPADSGAPADRRLTTGDPGRNAALWRAAGYEAPPTIAAMVGELAADRR